MNGRHLLKFLQTLTEDQLDLPIVASMPIQDANREEDVYPSSHASVLPNDLIGIHFPDCHVLRRSQDEQYAYLRKISGV